MPIHDWSRVEAGIFHDFHQRWIIQISERLNEGLLPSGFYALAEQRTGGPIPDVVTLERVQETNGRVTADIRQPGASAGGVAVAEHPPRVSHTHAIELEIYADLANRIAIHHVTGDEVVGYIEIVSPGNKHSEAAISRFCDKLEEALRGGCHALLIDLHSPTPRDPRGIHARFWEGAFGDDAPGVTDDRPLGLSAYRVEVDYGPTAYFEPTAVGHELIDMPAFLTPDCYVNIPLENSYQQAYRGVPGRWKEVIEDGE